MKLKFAFFVLTALCTATGCVKDYPENAIEPDVLPLSDAEPHYWAGNTKVVMKAQPEKSFIIFNGEDRYDIIDAEKMDYHVFKTAKVPEGRMFSKGLTRAADVENATWAIGSTRAFEMSEDKILYKSQAYTNSKGVDVFVSHLFYVKLKSAEDYPVLQRMADKNGVEIIGEVGARLDLWYKLACSTQSDCDALAMSARFYESGLFQYAEPDIMFEVRSCSKQPNSYPEYQAPTRAADAPAPNDPLFPQQWYLHNPGGLDINYLEAKAITQGSSDIKILLSDIQEITCDHPDLPEIVKYELPIDADDLHGTACAGIISAKTNNGEGITGIAPNCQLYYVQVPNTYNIDNAPTIADVFGCAFGMDVMSCSWHIPYIFDEHDCTMIETAIAMRFQDGRWHHTCEKDLGTVIVFAAGNDNSYDVCYPAITFSETIAVGAMLKNGKRHPLSNYGIRLDLVAPGENIVTTTTTIAGFDERYYTPFFDMTSSACPQVAAVAALILSVNPDLYYYEVENYLTATATELGRKADGSYENGANPFYLGAGLLNAGAALQAVLNDMEK